MPHSKNFRIAVVLCLGVVVVAVCGFAADDKEKPGAAALNARARRDAAAKVYDGMVRNVVEDPESVRHDLGNLYDWSVRWMQAERDLARTDAERIAACEGHVKRMGSWKANLDAAIQRRQAATYTAHVGEFFRLEAEAWLTAARAEAQ